MRNEYFYGDIILFSFASNCATQMASRLGMFHQTTGQLGRRNMCGMTFTNIFVPIEI